MQCPAVKVIAAAIVLCCATARAEKVVFRDELTRCEMWRLRANGR
jgi:hypothetical protein